MAAATAQIQTYYCSSASNISIAIMDIHLLLFLNKGRNHCDYLQPTCFVCGDPRDGKVTQKANLLAS